ncbi:hypothetical protein C8R47DRAFT_1223528 [Mycena vitilis]|nr:hypothetical protein C8R47DRAFT_1223528 [Mycena vitilis]
MSQAPRAAHCPPPFRPSPGHEDHRAHSANAAGKFYVVGVGRVPGIFTDEHTARAQVTRYSNGRWRKSKTYTGAIGIWNEMCALWHTHPDAVDTNSSAASSPPPSPSPSPPPPTVRSSGNRSTPPSAARHPSRSSGSSATAGLSRGNASSTPRPLRVVSSTRNRGEWRRGDTLWGIEGAALLFENRYDVVDHIYTHHLSPARLMESRNRGELEAFVGRRTYIRNGGDEVSS